MPKTEEFTDEELLASAQESETISSPEYDERESSESNMGETEDGGNQAELLEPGMQAVLEQKGGEPSDWTLAYRGDSGYHFDGENVRDLEGNVWINEDVALHQEMLAQWKEGGSAIFFLPDYCERYGDTETVYVTQMMLGEKGEVTYEIHKYETQRPRSEEENEEPDRQSDVSAAPRFEFGDRLAEPIVTEAVPETILHIEAAAATGIPVPEVADISNDVVAESIDEIVTAAEVAPEAPAVELATAADVSRSTEEKDGPDPWLVELLDFDRLGMENVHTASDVKAVPAQELVQPKQATPDDLREVLEIPTDLRGESSMRSNLAESYRETTRVERVTVHADARPAAEPITVAKHAEPTRDPAAKQGVPEVTPRAEVVNVPVEAIAPIAEHAHVKTSPEAINPVLTEISDKGTRESVEIAAKRTEEEPTHLQRVEIVLRALGLPVPNHMTLKSSEVMRTRDSSNMRATPFSPPHEREKNTKSGRFGRSRSRDGVILEMAA